jgi:hypothetical protein
VTDPLTAFAAARLSTVSHLLMVGNLAVHKI